MQGGGWRPPPLRIPSPTRPPYRRPVPGGTTAVTTLLAARRAGKSFDGVSVLRDVDFEVAGGEVHAVVGENGAGKSTLIKLLSGVHAPDSGGIECEGEPVRWQSPHEAQARGISVIHQEFSTLPDLSVEENVHLGIEPCTRLGLIRRAERRRRTRALLQRLAIDLDPAAEVGRLSVADRQMVEIAKALARRARVLILDEPTAVISGREVALLFENVRRLRTDGVGIVYISHRLDEVFEIADRVTVLKDGDHVATRATRQLDHDTLVKMMVGRELAAIFPPKAAVGGEGAVVLEAADIAVPGQSGHADLALRRGEVLGLAGMVGSGRTELAHVLFGAMTSPAGTVRLHGRPRENPSPASSLRAGLAYLTEDRKRDGLFARKSVVENLTTITLERHTARGLLRTGSEDAFARSAIADFAIQLSGPGIAVAALSGGNQQKVLLARLLAAEPAVVLLDEPTRGVDIGAKAEIYRMVRALADGGAAVLMISSELNEIIGMSDRVLVMRDGSIAGELEGASIREEAIMRLATLHPVMAEAGAEAEAGV